jgi:ribosomal protein S18 acetylase RimI-like enzyme
MDILTRLHAYFHTVDPDHTIDVLPSAGMAGDRHDAHISKPGATETLILACTQATFHPVPPLPGLHFVVLTRHSPLTTVQEGLDTNARGFDPMAAPATATEAEAFRRDLITNCAFTARLDDAPAAAGMFTPPTQGIAEVVGLTTLPSYRRRGIAAALTSEIVRVAFEHGVDIAILRTDNPIAYRIYTRIGFAPAVHLFRRPEASQENT